MQYMTFIVEHLPNHIQYKLSKFDNEKTAAKAVRKFEKLITITNNHKQKQTSIHKQKVKPVLEELEVMQNELKAKYQSDLTDSVTHLPEIPSSLLNTTNNNNITNNNNNNNNDNAKDAKVTEKMIYVQFLLSLLYK